MILISLKTVLFHSWCQSLIFHFLSFVSFFFPFGFVLKMKFSGILEFFYSIFVLLVQLCKCGFDIINDLSS